MRAILLALALTAAITVGAAREDGQGPLEVAEAHHLDTQERSARGEPTTGTHRPGCDTTYHRKRMYSYAKTRYMRRDKPLTAGQKTYIRHVAWCLPTREGTRWAFEKRDEWRAKFRARLYHQRNRLCGTPTCNGKLVYWMESNKSNSTQGGCLKTLAWHESGWDETNWNDGGSGAYGIGQALPPSKMKPWGADYMTNPRTQIKWMMAYVRDRYGSACAALYHFNTQNWY